MVLRHRCFPLKCLCWALFMLVAVKQGGYSQEVCYKNSEDERCKKHNLFINSEMSGPKSNKSEVVVFPGEEVVFPDEVVVLTVANEDSHGLQRFMRSAQIYDIYVEVLGMDEPVPKDEDLGGGFKINKIKERLKDLLLEEKKDKIVLYTDNVNAMFLGPLNDIMERFYDMSQYKVVFSAEQLCLPNPDLASKYPHSDTYNPYLNSGAFIGYLEEVAAMVSYKPVKNKEDDQLFFTQIYLDKTLREQLKIGLDHQATIFQNLNGALSDVQLRVNTSDDWPYLENVLTKQHPLIVHGNGAAKLTLNRFGNYLANSWSIKNGCAVCAEKKIELQENELPYVLVAVFIEQPTPFLEEFLQQILDIDYPKSKIQLLLRNNVEYHESQVDEFFNNHYSKYSSAKRIIPEEYLSEAEARNTAKDRCIHSNCEYLFSVDSVARVDSQTLRHLLATGHDVVAPMVTRPGLAWSNFWGAVNTTGYYARSADYIDIVNNFKRGIWNVPFITNCYLMKISVFRTKKAKQVTYSIEKLDPNMAFCATLRKLGIFMHITNERNFGHLVNPDTFNTSRTHPDIYQVIDNRIDWERRYLHEIYTFNFADGRTHLQPCQDVYWFPLMSERFCDEWVEIMEAYGKWSNGTNMDSRIEGGYEEVPTRDIHMKQVGLDAQWMHILVEYVKPLQKLVFVGYYSNPLSSRTKFVVRYRPNEQPSLRPHHDASTYTINLALNTPHVDYEGGGCRFVRYNCSVRDTRKGWLLMHPGRLTHLHEGLRVTSGTRYIMVTFMDP